MPSNPPPKISPVLANQASGVAGFISQHGGATQTQPTAPASVQGAFLYYTQAVGRYLPVQLTHARQTARRMLGTVR